MTKYPMPVIEFESDRGLDTPEFATFRLGGGYAKRLKRGQRVLVVHRGNAIYSAIVSKIGVGTVSEVLKDHAVRSHMEAGNEDDPALAPQRRFESLRRLYGPQRVDENRKLTFIYLKR